MVENSIQRLPDELINQIKAGEVVERPASVVKELVENSIDAKATSISVELLDGGKQLIRISDNGTGLSSSDLPLAIERHATSKLKSFSDLEKITSFGFRGEALPSIASVSEFSIKSKTEKQNLGNELLVSQGKILSQKELQMAQGTIIQAKDLFCHTPARLKFLKSTTTEYTHIHDFLQSMAFYYHGISFHLNHNGRDVFHFKHKESSIKRFEDILGPQAQDYVSISFARGSFKVHGFSLLPEKATTLPKYFVTFVNGRLVKDKTIRAGVLQAYHGLLLKGYLPSCVIFLEVDPSWIDVNVHPAKIEVRFTDPLAVQELLAIGIQNNLKKKINLNLGVEQKKTSIFHSPRTMEPEIKQRFHLSDLKTSADSFSSTKTPVITLRKSQEGERKATILSPFISEKTNASHFESQAQSPVHLVKLKNSEDIHAKLFTEQSKNTFSRAKYLGQFSDCYLILEHESQLWIIDQHAFHERILYEEYIKEYEKHPIVKQNLLTPVIVSSTPCISQIAEENVDKITKLGFEIEILNNGNIALHSYPAFLSPHKISQTFDDILAKLLVINGIPQSEVHPILEKAQQFSLQNEISSVKNTQLNQTEFYHLFYATLACHSAVRAGDPLNPELVQRLLQRGHDVDFFAHCPHGRPVIRKFAKKDVEAWFFRI